jgi:thiol-disulfide isomerase/thioredoxin
MPLAIGTSLPPLDGATEWLVGDIASIARQSSIARQYSPLLVQFWAMSCPICKINMPRVLAFLDTYDRHGLCLLSIHMPRGPWDMEPEKVQAASAELGLTGLSALDNEHTLGKLFQTGNVWPCYFLFDAEGRLRSRAAGQLGLKMAENSLRRMLEPADALEPVA